MTPSKKVLRPRRFTPITFAGLLVLAAVLNPAARADVVFSADFEGTEILASPGTLLLRNDPVASLELTSTTDAKLGDQVLLLDRETDQEFGLGLTLELSAALDLTGTAANFSFDYATRRTNGISKAIHVTGWDRAGNRIFHLVLGDAESFGNAQSDRQRPGYSTASSTQTLPAPNTPANYWWGSDTNDNGFFEVSKDAHFNLTIRSNGWDLSTTSQNGTNYTTLNLPTFDGQLHSDLARISMVNTSGTNFGGFWDNFLVEGTPAVAAVPTASILIDLHDQGREIERWGYDIKDLSKATGLTPTYAQSLFVEDGFDMLRIPILGEDLRPAHPSAGLVDASYYINTLAATNNALAAKPDLVIFASKKLAGQNSFPAWVKDGTGIIPAQYAILLADFLRYMEAEGIAVDILGIDNEELFNEGQITPAKHAATIDALRILSTQTPTFTVPVLIGAEDFNPVPNWVATLNSNGRGDTANLFGTHYYKHRPFASLSSMATNVGAKDFWNSEVHWDNLSPRDEMNEAEVGLATFTPTTNPFPLVVPSLGSDPSAYLRLKEGPAP